MLTLYIQYFSYVLTIVHASIDRLYHILQMRSPFANPEMDQVKKIESRKNWSKRQINPCYRRKQKINRSMPFKYNSLLLIFLNRSYLPSDSCKVVDTLFARHVSLTYAGCIFILLLLKHQCGNVLPCSVSAISHLTSQTSCSRKCDTELVPNLWHHNSFCCCALCSTSTWQAPWWWEGCTHSLVLLNDAHSRQEANMKV